MKNLRRIIESAIFTGKRQFIWKIYRNYTLAAWAAKFRKNICNEQKTDICNIKTLHVDGTFYKAAQVIYQGAVGYKREIDTECMMKYIHADGILIM